MTYRAPLHFAVFPYPVDWIGLGPSDARAVAAKLVELAGQAEQ